MPAPELYAAQGQRGALSYLPSPAGLVSGSPFSVTTTPSTVTLPEGAVMITVNTAAIHVRVTPVGQSLVAAGTGDVILPVQTVAIHVIPCNAGDQLSMRSVSGTAVVQISSVRTD